MKIWVQVKANSRQGNKILTDSQPGSYVVHLVAQPIEGKANKELINLLSEHFSVPKTQIKILRGANSRYKVIQVGQD